MSAFTLQLTDGIAVLTLDVPGAPVNALGTPVIGELEALLARIEADSAARAVVLISGKPDNFIAGADIEEFARLESAAEAERLSAEGQEMLERIARSPKPVAVGIHGSCLGGGLEFALACHYRVASDHPKTQLGLPEVQLEDLLRPLEAARLAPAPDVRPVPAEVGQDLLAGIGVNSLGYNHPRVKQVLRKQIKKPLHVSNLIYHEYQGRLAGDTILGRGVPPPGAADGVVPRVTFTDPQVAAVGLTETEARARREDIDVVTVSDGEEAIARMSTEQPDIVLADIAMPKKNGYEVLEEIKKDPALRHIPVVVMTTSNTEEDILACYGLHANCYIVKPIDLDQFMGTVRAVVNFWFSVVKLMRGK